MVFEEKYLPSRLNVYMMSPMEAWQSGLMHRSWKPTRVWVLREFESHRFRQIQKTLTESGFFYAFFKLISKRCQSYRSFFRDMQAVKLISYWDWTFFSWIVAFWRPWDEKYLPKNIFIYMIAPMEAWQSGLMHRSWKPTRVWVLREFESHRFRQIIFKYKLKLISNQ